MKQRTQTLGKGAVKVNQKETCPDANVGIILKETRLAKKLSLDDISKTLCITKSFLQRIEDQPETLSIDVYTLGFLKAYSKFLDLDADQLVAKFKAANTTITPEETLTFPKPLQKRGIPHIRLVSISLAFLFLLIAGWEVFNKPSPSPSPSLDVEKLAQKEDMVTDPSETSPHIVKVADVEPSQPPQVFTGEVPITQDTHPDSPVIISPSANLNLPEDPLPPATIQASNFEDTPNHTVVLSFSEESWIQIKDDQGQVIVNRTFQPGEQYKIDAPQGYSLKTGNAGGVTLIVGNQDLGKLGTTGQVMKDILLDPEKLLAQPTETY